MSDLTEKRQQVADQYRAVAHMARAIAQVHEDIGKMINAGIGDQLLDIRGNASALIMETLGDILNNLDAVTEEDEWVAPILRKAQMMWPQS